MSAFWVYILASKKYGTLYIGVTSNLPKRVFEHQSGQINGFTKTYRVHHLVYAEPHETADAAILREKRMKAWKREWKISLIEQDNPHWIDLSKSPSFATSYDGSLLSQG